MTIAKVIDGSLFKELMICGANNLHNNAKEVNDLNVFPIPDGDTGENMYLTIRGGVEMLKSVSEGTVSDMANAMSQGMLLNARGNSGVILSQLFFGVAEGLSGLKEATLSQFALAMNRGVKRAYGAVANPVEGTILTVARESIQNINEEITETTTVKEFFDKVFEEMKTSLAHTPELLATLKEAGVIDSGGAGLLYIIEGICKASAGEKVLDEIAVTIDDSKTNDVDFSKFTKDSQMVFGYCTELLVQLQSSKCDVDAFSIPTLIEFLNSIGDSVVAFKTGSVVKLHIHTMMPYKVLEYCQAYGEYLTVKIENMTLQHNEIEEPKPKQKQNSTLSEMSKKVKRARRKFALVTVASGEGLVNMFKDLGADVVIEGGQTNNPSTEEFVRAFDEVNADHVFVLPNNSNIIFAAKQAAQMYADSDIRVIESKSIGEGYAGLSMLDYSIGDADVIENQIKNDMLEGETGLITKAVRTTSVNGVSVTEGDYIGFTRGNMLVSVPDKMDAATKLLDQITPDKNFLIAVYGFNTTDSEKQALSSIISQKFKGLEFYEIDGGQDVYDFIFILE